MKNKFSVKKYCEVGKNKKKTSIMRSVRDIYCHYHTLPVVRLISIARCRCPRTLNWGRETSLLTPTLFGPSFHLYRISRIVYPTVNKIENPLVLIHTYRNPRQHTHVPRGPPLTSHTTSTILYAK